LMTLQVKRFAILKDAAFVHLALTAIHARLPVKILLKIIWVIIPTTA